MSKKRVPGFKELKEQFEALKRMFDNFTKVINSFFKDLNKKLNQLNNYTVCGVGCECDSCYIPEVQLALESVRREGLIRLNF